MPKNNFIILLNETTRIFIYFENDKKAILKFVIKLEIFIDGEWIEIERYDTGHGYVHKDIFNREGKKKFIQKFNFLDKRVGLNFAIEDFRQNYHLYIWRYLNG